LSGGVCAYTAAASRGLLPNIPLFHRQTSSSSMGDNLPAMGPVRRPSHAARAASTSSRSARPSNPAARRRWRKIRFAIAFICKAKIPDGPKGEMCRSVQDDVDFGRYFLMGTNTATLRRCVLIPANFAVTDRDVEGYLSPGKTLAEAAAVRSPMFCSYYDKGGVIFSCNVRLDTVRVRYFAVRWPYYVTKLNYLQHIINRHLPARTGHHTDGNFITRLPYKHCYSTFISM